MTGERSRSQAKATLRLGGAVACRDAADFSEPPRRSPIAIGARGEERGGLLLTGGADVLGRALAEVLAVLEWRCDELVPELAGRDLGYADEANLALVTELADNIAPSLSTRFRVRPMGGVYVPEALAAELDDFRASSRRAPRDHRFCDTGTLRARR